MTNKLKIVIPATSWFLIAAMSLYSVKAQAAHKHSTPVPAVSGRAAYATGLAAYARRHFTSAGKDFRAAAARGFAPAQYKLGLMYYLGLGVPTNYSQAAHWFQLSATRGFARAQYSLSLLYAEGQGVPRNYARALHWDRLAVAQGSARAAGALGLMYFRGQGVPRNYVKAYQWTELAQSQGVGVTRNIATGFLHQMAEYMTPGQIAKAQRAMQAWRAAHPHPRR